MTTELVTRRLILKYASIISFAARTWDGLAREPTSRAAKGYGRDPDLLKRPVPWSRTLNATQLKALAALCAIVLPDEGSHPSAADIGVHEFLDEWISAPYPQMQADRAVILNGLVALDDATRRELGIGFAAAELPKQTKLFDQLCSDPVTIDFTRRLIELVCAGYYTTREGHAAIGYVGNVGLASFPAPTQEVIRHLEQALSELPGKG